IANIFSLPIVRRAMGSMGGEANAGLTSPIIALFNDGPTRHCPALFAKELQVRGCRLFVRWAHPRYKRSYNTFANYRAMARANNFPVTRKLAGLFSLERRSVRNVT